VYETSVLVAELGEVEVAIGAEQEGVYEIELAEFVLPVP
jgi:hypothetical protein